MVTVVGVRFREVGKIYYFDPGELELKTGDNVIVDTIRGTEFGTVMIANRKVEDEEIVQPLKVVRRKATDDDMERVKANREKEKNAFAICKEKVKERGLEMKLISAEYTFDNAKILFYFTADGRVDFRELVKDLAAVFRIRIELRQVGVRDETKLMGGLGGCGRPLCCASYLSDFVPVSIRMAKEQNLSLNPQKISGVCGRLMCCLKNEADTYEDINTRIPKEGAKVVTPDGREGIAETVNVLRERVRVLFTDEQGNREMEEFPAGELQFTPRRKAKPCEQKAAKDAAAAENITGEYDFDAAELVAEADSETDPDIKALVRAEAEDAAGERDGDEADANMVGDRKRRRRRHRRRPAEAGNTGEAGDVSAAQGDTAQGGEAQQDKRQEKRHQGERRQDRNRQDRKPQGDRQQGENTQDGDSAGGVRQGDASQGDMQQGERHRRRRHHHHSGNGGENTNKTEGAESAGDGSTEGSDQNSGTEKKRNGTYRRFRKRRPKDTAES